MTTSHQKEITNLQTKLAKAEVKLEESVKEKNELKSEKSESSKTRILIVTRLVLKE
jgi:hypothetical protein